MAGGAETHYERLYGESHAAWVAKGNPFPEGTKRHELWERITEFDTPSAVNNSMVDFIWSDGEITSQKAGHLLWQRSVRTDFLNFAIPGVDFKLPHSRVGTTQTFCILPHGFTSKKELRTLMVEAMGEVMAASV